MYLCGQSSDKVQQYNLSTAWNISTGSYVANTSILTQDTSSVDLHFKPDGTTMYLLGDATNTVYQYTLGTPWDITTSTYSSKSFSVAAQDGAPTGIWFKPDGTIMYVLGATNDIIFQYTLGTAWDITTASYASISFSAAAQDSGTNALVLSSDGTKLWVTGSTSDKIYEYNDFISNIKNLIEYLNFSNIKNVSNIKNYTFEKKLEKGYVRVNKSRLDQVYPEFETDLQKTAVWAMLGA